MRRNSARDIARTEEPVIARDGNGDGQDAGLTDGRREKVKRALREARGWELRPFGMEERAKPNRGGTGEPAKAHGQTVREPAGTWGSVALESSGRYGRRLPKRRTAVFFILRCHIIIMSLGPELSGIC